MIFIIITSKANTEIGLNLLFTDTDSLAYEIKTDDFYADISADIRSWFDTSDYPKDHPSGIETGINKKVIGMFKDEAAGKQIEEFVGLRSKLYSYKMAGVDYKKCKGVRKNVVKKSITHEDYKNCLFTRREQSRKMNVIRSHHHEIYTEEINKIALSADDDKRVIQQDGINTLAYGHYSLKNYLKNKYNNIKWKLTKVCTKCKMEKSLNEFHKDKRKKSGYQSSCKICKNIKAKELRQKYSRLETREDKR